MKSAADGSVAPGACQRLPRRCTRWKEPHMARSTAGDRFAVQADAASASSDGSSDASAASAASAEAESSAGVKSARRAVELLEAFGTNHAWLSLTDLHQQ